MIIQIGSKKYPVQKELGKEIMQKFVATWKERNPQLELIGAYYHADEQGSPHVHIDYVPVAYNQTRGLKTQNAMNAALQQMGFKSRSSRDTAQCQWTREQNKYLEQLCKEKGLEIIHPGRKGEKHKHTDEYKIAQQQQEAIEEQKKHLVAIKTEAAEIQTGIDTMKPEYEKIRAYTQTINNEQSSILEGVREEKGLLGKPTGNVILSKKEYQKRVLPYAEKKAVEAAAAAVDETVQKQQNRINNRDMTAHKLKMEQMNNEALRNHNQVLRNELEDIKDVIRNNPDLQREYQKALNKTEKIKDDINRE